MYGCVCIIYILDYNMVVIFIALQLQSILNSFMFFKKVKSLMAMQGYF